MRLFIFREIIQGLIISMCFIHYSCSRRYYQWETNIYNVNLGNLKNQILNRHYYFGTELIYNEGNYKIVFLSSKNKVISVSISDNTIDSFTVNGKISGTYFGDENCGVLVNDLFILYSYTGEILHQFHVPMTHDEFILSPMYSPSIRHSKDFYYFQIGFNDRLPNYIGPKIFQFFNDSMNTTGIQYPSEYYSEYQHYNKILMDCSNDTCFYVSATIPKLFKTDFKNNGIDSVRIPGRFSSFDTTGLHDLLYIQDFTLNNSYNIDVFSTFKYIYVFQRGKIMNKRRKLFLYAFDKELHLLSTHELTGDIDISYANCIQNKLYFLDIVNNKLVECYLK